MARQTALVPTLPQPVTLVPSLSFAGPAKRPNLIVDSSDLPATARELRDLFACSGRFFERGDGIFPVTLVHRSNGDPPRASPLTPHRIVYEAHEICRPLEQQVFGLKPVTLPDRVARMYLAMHGEWCLPPLAGITTAPVLAPDGTLRTAAGYDPDTQLWCAGVPTLRIPDQPTRNEAETSVRRLRETFWTFPFSDGARRKDKSLGLEVLDLDQPPGLDESTFMVGLLTAICRPNLWLAPGFLVRAPEISGAGTGKGLLVRSICAIAFGIPPRAFTQGGNRQELDKRLASDLVEAAPTLLLDNVNATMLRSDTLASVLTERPARVRLLGQSRMVALNSTAFIAVTGNGLSVAEDLARRFIVCELDARCEDPEQRGFESGFLGNIESRRAELLAAALTIWRWGRQNATGLAGGKPLGSFEQWTEWCRDPLLALGCRDPVERIEGIKSDDPHRRRIVEIFEAWYSHHADRPVKGADLAEPVLALVDPQGKGRQFVAARLGLLAGTCAGGFVMTREKPAGKWGAATYSLVHSKGTGA